MAKTTPPAAPVYGMPPHLMGGNVAGSSAAGFPQPIGKTRSIQNLGNIIGRRAAGISKAAGGDVQQMSHAFDNYGKAKESALKTGDLD
jgi:hypothetical protein